jgi:hypothetical protein
MTELATVLILKRSSLSLWHVEKVSVIKNRRLLPSAKLAL